MEIKGMINMYTCRQCHKRTFTINLHSGVTPFGIKCPHCDYIDCFSSMYRLEPMSRITITHAFYRPAVLANPEVEDHVFNGGLLFAELTVAIQCAAPLNHDVKTSVDAIRCARELWAINLKANSEGRLIRE